VTSAAFFMASSVNQLAISISSIASLKKKITAFIKLSRGKIEKNYFCIIEVRA
jgi:hypothetical protein